MTKTVIPKVYIISETGVNLEGLLEGLTSLGGEVAVHWLISKGDKNLEQGELLIEVAGRTCYKSFGIGLNPNVTKIREDTAKYFQNTLSKGDGSIFEHGTVTFLFVDISRVFTHELVRHRPGIAISQESLRYKRVGEDGLYVWLPNLEKFEKYLNVPQSKGYINKRMYEDMDTIEDMYFHLEKMFDWSKLKADDLDKELTSALRRILPQGMATNAVWTANHRILRHIIEVRTSRFAEIEMRLVFDMVASLLKKKYPLIYQDFERTVQEDGIGSWIPSLRSKV